MIDRTRALALGSGSVLAIMAALAPSQALADCIAFSAGIGTNAVGVVCGSGDVDVASFATSYSDSTGDGDDGFNMNGGLIVSSGPDTPEVLGTDGDTLDPSVGVIQLLGGGDVVNISGGQIGEVGAPVNIELGDGDDTFNMSDGTLNGSVFGGDGDDVITVSDNAVITGVPSFSAAIETGAGNNEVRILGGTIGTDPATLAIFLEDGANVFTMSGGTVNGNIAGQGGGNTYTVSSGIINGSLFAGSGDDEVTISGDVEINAIPGADDAIGLDTGDDTFNMSGGAVNGNVSGNAGNDTFVISNGTILGFLNGNEGVDSIAISGGSISGNVSGGSGNDAIGISGGTIAGSVFGDDGDDSVVVSGGSIAGGIDAETVTLTGGTIGGDITGISGNTLVINDSLSVDPLSLRNGVVFSGTNAVGTISNTDLAQGGAFTQVFTGFSSVTADASTLGFGTGTFGIGSLSLLNGSTLYINGVVNMPGTASVTGSTIQMIDGVADDVFMLGGIALNGATLGLDINQQTLQADQIVASAFSATGTNTILVNLLGTPEFSQATSIPIIVTGDPVVGDFVISGVPGTVGSLFTYELVAGPDGGLSLLIVPSGVGVVLATQNAIDVATVDTALDALYGINNDAIAHDLGLANGTLGVSITPTLSVFASGQFAHVEHGGFEISSGGITGVGPGFGVDEFSAAISLDFNAAKAFDLDPKYGLNLGLFGGYASADVDVGAFQTFPQSGEATNRSGMFGGYGLFRQGYNYALVSAIAFLGQSDITNDILGTTGDYDTQGYGVTASAGHIFVLSDRLRFDLRGGILGVTFTGGDYVDSGGNRYGESRISFGALKFEPGIYADYQLENGMVISPYARADFQQRFGYSNKATIDDVEVEFDDADFSAALYGGFNLKMTERSTLSSEIRGKWSADSTTLAGKLGLKIAF